MTTSPFTSQTSVLPPGTACTQHIPTTRATSRAWAVRHARAGVHDSAEAPGPRGHDGRHGRVPLLRAGVRGAVADDDGQHERTRRAREDPLPDRTRLLPAALLPVRRVALPDR